MRQHRPTCKVKIFVHMNLSYELIKRVYLIAVVAILTAEVINDKIHVIVDYRIGICPFNVNKCEITDTLLPLVLRR